MAEPFALGLIFVTLTNVPWPPPNRTRIDHESTVLTVRMLYRVVSQRNIPAPLLWGEIARQRFCTLSLYTAMPHAPSSCAILQCACALPLGSTFGTAISPRSSTNNTTIFCFYLLFCRYCFPELSTFRRRITANSSETPSQLSVVWSHKSLFPLPPVDRSLRNRRLLRRVMVDRKPR